MYEENMQHIAVVLLLVDRLRFTYLYIA